MSMIYLIGGTPRAGKSTLAMKAVKEKAIPFLSTDVVLHMVSDTQPELSLTKPYADIPVKFFPYLSNLIKHVQSSIKDYVIEGDLFSPSQVVELQKSYSVKACFLGFSRVTLEDIQRHVGENNWLNDLSETERQNLPQWIVEKSQEIKQACKANAIRYFDMADGTYEQNLVKAYAYLFENRE